MDSNSQSSWTTVLIATISVLGTLSATTLANLFNIVRENRKEKRDEKKEIKEKCLKSDIACWKKIKQKLDLVYTEIHRIRPGARPSPDGEGWMYDPFVESAHKELIDAANDVLMVLNSVAFFDEMSKIELDSIMKIFREILVNANQSAYYRNEIQKHKQTQYVDSSTEANKKAVEHLDKFDELYKKINLLVRDSVGYDNIIL